ncbi:MAG: hypothetical protein A2W37_10995 [Chloroflexi bacterium RBG_16_63_12]|nr:MAG: hypothetical protein A2W37_10995 [Chloroflexi bacterium RBG_16_63_12]
MDIKILSSEEVEFKEKDVQKAFEHEGTVTLSPTKGLPEKVKNWIETAREFVPSKPDDESEVEEEN